MNIVSKLSWKLEVQVTDFRLYGQKDIDLLKFVIHWEDKLQVVDPWICGSYLYWDDFFFFFNFLSCSCGNLR